MANILMRGAYDKEGEKVTPAGFSALHAMPADAPKNRLGLARWLVAPENPLTARVTVNRFWQELFGTGLVKTAGGFRRAGRARRRTRSCSTGWPWSSANRAGT